MAHDDFTSKPVFVYLIEEADSQRFVKIGIAHNPKRRIADLQVGNARLLHIRYLLACEASWSRLRITTMRQFQNHRYRRTRQAAIYGSDEGS